MDILINTVGKESANHHHYHSTPSYVFLLYMNALISKKVSWFLEEVNYKATSSPLLAPSARTVLFCVPSTLADRINLASKSVQ